jgi:peptide/nickel transport system permease protein
MSKEGKTSMVTPTGQEMFEATTDTETSAPRDEQKIVGRTPRQLAWMRFRRDKVSMIAMVLVALAVVVGIASPIMEKLHWIKPYETHQNLVTGIGSVPTGAFGGASSQHWLGVVPGIGWDLMDRLLAGITLSLVIATSATVLSVVIGTLFGLISGYLGKWPDFWISRTMDLVLAFPQLLMLLALSPVLKSRITSLGVPSGNPTAVVYLILVLGFFGWPYFARIIRGQVLSLREREFVEAARSLGAPRRRIYFKELLPNLWAPILIYFTLNLPTNISSEAALSYLGVGVQSPTPTLGTLLSDSSTYATSDPTFFFLPGLIICILVLSFNLLGDGLRDALDPKSSR